VGQRFGKSARIMRRRGARGKPGEHGEHGDHGEQGEQGESGKGGEGRPARRRGRAPVLEAPALEQRALVLAEPAPHQPRQQGHDREEGNAGGGDHQPVADGRTESVLQSVYHGVGGIAPGLAAGGGAHSRPAGPAPSVKCQ